MSKLSVELFRFLADLKANNSKEWFAQNKDRYEEEVREPLLAFVRAFAPRLEAISPYFVASDRKSGGSLFRIHRDVRFSHDKSPYKTNAGVQFRHENGKDAHTPGFYLHLDPNECFCAGGVWRPDAETLRAVRDRILEKPAEWKKVTGALEGFTLGGESLKNAPRGYDPAHPLIEDLKRKDHVAFRALSPQQITAPDFLDLYTDHCRTVAPYLRFIAQALGQPF
jgi:uncharacterized protein (TIGR02453 family)